MGPEGQGISGHAEGANNGEGWGTGSKVSVIRGGSRKKAIPKGALF